MSSSICRSFVAIQAAAKTPAYSASATKAHIYDGDTCAVRRDGVVERGVVAVVAKEMVGEKGRTRMNMIAGSWRRRRKPCGHLGGQQRSRGDGRGGSWCYTIVIYILSYIILIPDTSYNNR